jgi:hypothetical protein
LGAVRNHSCAETVEDGEREAFGVAFFEKYARRYCADENSFGDTARAMTTEETGYFSSTSRVPEEHGVFEVEVLH